MQTTFQEITIQEFICMKVIANSIQSNRIGLAQSGNTKIGNVDGGIRIIGVANGTQNKIKFNTITGATGVNTSSTIGNGYGVFIGGTSATGNLISENSISCNVGLEINLRLINPNFGANAPGNSGKSTPVINPITTTSTYTAGAGTAGDTIEVYANPSNCGCGGEIFMGKTKVAADGTWSLTHPVIDSVNVAALAIAANGNTSEFSCKKAVKGTIAVVPTTCLGDTTTLTASDYKASQLKWEIATDVSFGNIIYTAFDDPTISPSTINFKASTSGAYQARLISIVSSNETDTSLTRSFVVTAPTPLGIITGSSSICAGTSTTLSIPATGSFIWYDSIPGETWTVISGATTATITRSPAQTTYYFAEVATNSCVSPTPVKSVTVTPTTPISVALNVDQNDVCEGTSQTFTASVANAGSGAAYQWKVDGLNAGTNSHMFTSSSLVNNQLVSVVVTPDTACPSAITYTPQSIKTVITSIIKLSISQSSATICDGDSSLLTVIPNNASTYKWSRLLTSGSYEEISDETAATIYVKPVTQTFYKVEAIGGKCLIASDSVSVDVSSSVVGSVSVNQPAAVCGTGSITFTANANNVGMTIYSWFVKKVDDDSFTLNSQTTSNNISLSLEDGDSLYVEVVASSPCASAPSYKSNRVGIDRNSLVIPTISLFTDEILCEQSDITIQSSITNGGTSPIYKWYVNDELVLNSTDSLVISNATDGDQVVLFIKSSAECTPDSVKSETFIISVISETVFSISINDYQKCLEANGLMSLTATTSISAAEVEQYEWYVNGIAQYTDTSFFEFVPTIGDRVVVGASSSRDCLDEDTTTSNQLMVQFSTPVVANGGEDKLVETLDQIELSGILSENATDYRWYQYLSNDTLFLDDSIIVNVVPLPSTSVYELTASNKFCSDTDRVIISFIPQQIEIPNVFSPNQDDLHDRWVINNSELFSNISIQVFNRWGTLVFESISGDYTNANAWDGTYNDKPLPVATYYYIIRLNDGSEPFKGPVTILR